MINHIDDKLIESTYLFCVRRIADGEDAKDLSQDILCEAIKAVQSGKSFVSFYSWYWRMARNKYADYISHKMNPMQPLECAVNVASDIIHPIDKLINEEDLSELNYALSRLSAMRREIMIRFYLKEQSIAEIADALEFPIGTVKSRLFDAKCGETKAVGWSNLHQQFKTAEYGLVEYVNDFQKHPFPAEGEEIEKGRDKWVDGNNIGLLLELAANPKLQLNDHEQEMAAEFIKNGLVVKTSERLRVMLPIVGKTMLEQVHVMMVEALRDVAEEYANLVAEKVEELLEPYVRKDLMSNFIHWDMKLFFQPIPYLLYYGMHETDLLAIPEDYSRSAAGLMIVKWDE